MSNETQQAQLLDAYIDALRNDPHAQAPAALDPEMARFAHRVTSTQTDAVAGAKERVRQRLNQHSALTNTARQNGRIQIQIDRMEQRMKREDKQKRTTRSLPLTLVATLILVVGIGIGAVLWSQIGDNFSVASDPAMPIVPITATPVATSTPSSTMTPTFTTTPVPTSTSSSTMTPTFTTTPTFTMTPTFTTTPVATSTPSSTMTPTFTTTPVPDATSISAQASRPPTMRTCTITIPDTPEVPLRQGPSLGAAIALPLTPGLRLDVLAELQADDGTRWYHVRPTNSNENPIGWIQVTEAIEDQPCQTVTNGPEGLLSCDPEFAALSTEQQIYTQGEAILLEGYANAENFGSAQLAVRGVTTNNTWIVFDTLTEAVERATSLAQFSTVNVAANRYELRLSVFNNFNELLTACTVIVDITSS